MRPLATGFAVIRNDEYSTACPTDSSDVSNPLTMWITPSFASRYVSIISTGMLGTLSNNNWIENQ